MKKKITKRRTSPQQISYKRLLQLNIVYSEYPWLSWENVHHLGKNNIQYLIKELREEIQYFKSEASELIRPYQKGALPHSKASKELRVLTYHNALWVQHRQEAMVALRHIAKKSVKKPYLPGFGRTAVSFGEATFEYPFDGTWEIVTNQYGVLYNTSRYYDVTLIQELQTCTDRDFMRIWRKVATATWGKNTSKALLNLSVPTQLEIVTKRLKGMKKLQDTERIPSDELLHLIATDEAWLKEQETEKEKN
jgi:hypothetical protein